MEKTKIQWTDSTVNFWTGCNKVSEGCKFCYMYRDKDRYGQDPTTVKRTLDNTFYQAQKWSDPRKIFTCSWSDFFIEEADQYRADAWDVLRKTPHHQWQILTKRPERIIDCLPSDWGEKGYPNVWLGVSVENDNYLHRIDTLRQIPAAIRFISAEPLLGPINLNGHLQGIDWVIIGGESGNENGKYRYRECKDSWILDIIQVCQQAGVAVFVKQLGTHLAKALGYKDRHGGDWDEWDTALKVREFPQYVQLQYVEPPKVRRKILKQPLLAA